MPYKDPDDRRKWRARKAAENPEAVKAQNKRYNDKRRRSEAGKAYVEATREERNAYWRNRYAADPERFRAKYKRWREANLELARELHREWERANPSMVRSKNRDYMARKREAFVAKVDELLIFERDRFKCQLCQGDVDMTLRFPHPWSPSIDYVRPLAKGGTHEPDNVQLAHLRCNQQKKDREPREEDSNGTVDTRL